MKLIRSINDTVTDELGGGGGSVDSVFTRTGAVVAATSDYDADQIDVTPVGSIAATDVQAALEELDSEKAPVAHTHVTTAITSGVFADARVQESNVTQHEAAIDHDALVNFAIGEHRVINDAAASLTELWSASKVNAEFDLVDTAISGKADTSHTHATADITSGTFADARVQESNVTQHEAALDHNALTNYALGQHRTINDAGSATTDLWSADKIATEVAGAGGGGDTLPVVDETGIVHKTGDVTAEVGINAAAISTSEIRFITMPDQNIDLTPGSGSFAAVIHTHTTAEISGQLLDSHVIASNVTQHVASIDHNALLNFRTDTHRTIDDGSVAVTDLWSADKITTELGTKAASSHNHAASEVTSGTLVDARIAASNVTQHEAALDHNALTNYAVNQHRIINDAGTSLTELWSANKINAEFNLVDTAIAAVDHDTITNYVLGQHRVIDDLSNKTIDLWSADKIITELTAKAETSHNHAATEITSGSIADARIPSSNVTQHVGAIDHNSLLNYVVGQHRTINDAGSATTDLFSADKIVTQLATKIGLRYAYVAKASGTQAITTLADATLDSEQLISDVADFTLATNEITILKSGVGILMATMSFNKTTSNVNSRVQLLCAHDLGAGYTYPSKAFVSGHVRVSATSGSVTMFYLADFSANDKIKYQHRLTAGSNVNMEASGLHVILVQLP
jgi:hypothetical protein